jgi:Uncharacterized protein conserved in bacteria (DUF2332)
MRENMRCTKCHPDERTSSFVRRSFHCWRGLRRPLALLELGAAAGPCLLPDAYAYDYEAIESRQLCLHPRRPEPFSVGWLERRCPTGRLEIIWRAGLGLRPIDIVVEVALISTETSSLLLLVLSDVLFIAYRIGFVRTIRSGLWS